jgi:hypothetical protein
LTYQLFCTKETLLISKGFIKLNSPNKSYLDRSVYSNIIIAVILVFFFILFTGPIEDGDCFWHLNTGKWIAEHRTIPASDPFSFTITDHNPFRPDSGRVKFLLKQYWLGQLALYGLWSLSGDAGIVLLRAACYTIILAGLYLWMRRLNKGILPAIAILLTGILLKAIPNERPQLFSFVLMPLLLFLLEKVSDPQKPRYCEMAAIPLIILIWANIHGAYILGVVLCCIYLLSHLFLVLIRKTEHDGKLIVTLSTALIISIANPNGIGAFTEIFQVNRGYAASIYENLSPFYVTIKLHQFFLPYWVFLIASLATLVIHRKQIHLRHFLVISCLLLLSLSALRYMIFPLLAAPLIIKYFPDLRLDKLSVAVFVSGLVLWICLSWSGNIFTFRPLPSFPVKAAEFLIYVRPSPQLFNYYNWGGYLPWKIPGLKVFVDGRGLAEELSNMHDEIMHGSNWEPVFNKYGVNLVVIPSLSPTSGVYFKLVDKISSSPEWFLVYYDSAALVFCRNVSGNSDIISRFNRDKHEVKQQIVLAADRMIAENPKLEPVWIAKANALQLLGRRNEAVAAYERVLKLNPSNKWARTMLGAGGR